MIEVDFIIIYIFIHQDCDCSLTSSTHVTFIKLIFIFSNDVLLVELQSQTFIELENIENYFFKW